MATATETGPVLQKMTRRNQILLEIMSLERELMEDHTHPSLRFVCAHCGRKTIAEWYETHRELERQREIKYVEG